MLYAIIGNDTPDSLKTHGARRASGALAGTADEGRLLLAAPFLRWMRLIRCCGLTGS